MTDTRTIEQVEIDPTTGAGRVSHIVAPDGKQTASALVTEARVYGMEVEALCGHRWVPERDPKQYPLCEGCKSEWDRRFPDDGEGPSDA